MIKVLQQACTGGTIRSDRIIRTSRASQSRSPHQRSIIFVLSFLALVLTPLLSLPAHAAMGDFITQFGQTDLYRPTGIALDSSGNVYVVDSYHHRVVVYSNTGAFLRTWGSLGTTDGKFHNPSAIAVDSSGNVYVTDIWPYDGLARVQVFTNTGTFLRKWGTYGTGDGQFTAPMGIAVDAGGNVYVADSSTYYAVARVQVFNNSGVFLRKFGSFGNGDGQFTATVGIALDSAGNIYVVDTTRARVQVFDNAGTFLLKWGQSCNNPSLPACDGQFNAPRYIAVDAGGNVYVTDTNNKRVEVFTSTGTFLGKWGVFGTGDGQFTNAMGIAVGEDGNVYVADSTTNGGRIEVFEGSCMLIADAGPDQAVEQTFFDGASVTLDGSGTRLVGACAGTLDYSWSWPGGSATGVNPAVLLPPGATTVTLSVTDGTRTSTDSMVITVHDTQAPSTSAMISGMPGTNGWYISDAGISLTAVDSGTGVREIRYVVDGTETAVPGSLASFSIVSEGTHTVTYYATDSAGNSETPHILSIKIDKTPPTVSGQQTPLPNENGWNKTDVSVTCTCSDALSGIVSCTDPATLGEGGGQVVTCSAADAAGLTAVLQITVNVDKTPPLVTTTFTAGAVPTASHTVTDSLSGMASDSGTFTPAAPSSTYTVRAADRAGNTADITAVYTAIFN